MDNPNKLVKINELTKLDASSRGALVAAEVRGSLAKIKMPTYKLCDYLGQSRDYWQRRVSGRIPFNVDDLGLIADLIGVDIRDLLPASEPRPLVNISERRHKDYEGDVSRNKDYEGDVLKFTKPKEQKQELAQVINIRSAKIKAI